MTYRIFFAGTVLSGFERSEVETQLGQRMKLGAQSLARLFSGERVQIKRDLDEAGARKFVDFMQQLGAAVEVEPALPEASAGIPPVPLSMAPVDPETGGDAVAARTSLASSAADQLNPYQAPGAQKKNLYCRLCGAAVPARAANCPACGADQALGKPKSKYVAAALAFFFGWLGAHRFYLGQWWGILYLIFYFVLWPVSLIESVVFLCTSQQRWDEKYGDVKSLGGVVVLVILLFFGTAVVGILAAVAIPAYQDYVTRSLVMQAVTESETYRDQMEEFVQRTSFVPNGNLDMGLPESISTAHIVAMRIGTDGVMTLQLSGSQSLVGKTMVWTPDFSSRPAGWRCDAGTLENRFRPVRCRN